MPKYQIMNEWPVPCFRADLEVPLYAHNEKELKLFLTSIEEGGKGCQRDYIHRDFPRTLYQKGNERPGRAISQEHMERMLAEGWSVTPFPPEKSGTEMPSNEVAQLKTEIEDLKQMVRDLAVGQLPQVEAKPAKSNRKLKLEVTA